MTRQAQRRYNGMFLGVFELLMIKRMEIEASVGYVKTLKNYWLAHTDMTEILAGRLPIRPADSKMIMPASRGNAADGGH